VGGQWDHAYVRDIALFFSWHRGARCGNEGDPVRYWGRLSADASRGCSSMVELQPSKLVMRVRFPSSAPPGESCFPKELKPRMLILGPSAGQIAWNEG
jgi:hypothetical protein